MCYAVPFDKKHNEKVERIIACFSVEALPQSITISCSEGDAFCAARGNVAVRWLLGIRRATRQCAAGCAGERSPCSCVLGRQKVVVFGNA